MRTKYLLFLLMSIFALSTHTTAETKKSKADYTQTVIFEVSMTCENCRRKIEKNIAFEKGVKAMEVNLGRKQVKLTFDTRKTSEENLINAFSKLGYKAVLVENSNTKKIE